MTTWTLEDLHEIEKAIAMGALTVTYSGAGQNKSVTYRSLDDMLKVRDLIRKHLGLTDPCGQRILTRYRKGYS